MPKIKDTMVISYKVSVNEMHHSGIGTKYIKTIKTRLKPGWDNCDFFDATNGEWAVYNGSDNCKKHQAP